MDKKLLRRQMRDMLAEFSSQQRKEKSKKACQNLVAIEQFRSASVIMFFLSLPHEIDTTDAILCSWQQGKTVAAPKVSWQQRHMLPIEITSLDSGLETETGGLRNPVTGMPMPIEEIDLIVTPGLAFDRIGNRLGRGGAYFDKFFASEQLRAEKCALAFSEQVVDSVPTEQYDKKVDMVVTDAGVIECKAKSGGQ